MVIIAEIKEFLEYANNQPFNATKWFNNDDMQVYLRKGYHLLDNTKAPNICLDIANIEIYGKGQGTFSKWFLPQMIALNPWDAIYVECIQNPRFAKWFSKNGWTKHSDNYPPSYYLMRNNYE